MRDDVEKNLRENDWREESVITCSQKQQHAVIRPQSPLEQWYKAALAMLVYCNFAENDRIYYLIRSGAGESILRMKI